MSASADTARNPTPAPLCRAELVAMRRAGASCADLAEWLRLHRCRIHRSSIDRYLKRLPELYHAEFPISEGPG